jgi:histidyl-tRNA synthetase
MPYTSNHFVVMLSMAPRLLPAPPNNDLTPSPACCAKAESATKAKAIGAGLGMDRLTTVAQSFPKNAVSGLLIVWTTTFPSGYVVSVVVSDQHRRFVAVAHETRTNNAARHTKAEAKGG